MSPVNAHHGLQGSPAKCEHVYRVVLGKERHYTVCERCGHRERFYFSYDEYLDDVSRHDMGVSATRHPPDAQEH